MFSILELYNKTKDKLLAKGIIRIELFPSYPYDYIDINIDINKILYQKSVLYLFPMFWRTLKKFHCACIILCSALTKLLEELYFADSMFHIFSHQRVIFCLKL